MPAGSLACLQVPLPFRHLPMNRSPRPRTVRRASWGRGKDREGERDSSLCCQLASLPAQVEGKKRWRLYKGVEPEHVLPRCAVPALRWRRGRHFARALCKGLALCRCPRCAALHYAMLATAVCVMMFLLSRPGAVAPPRVARAVAAPLGSGAGFAGVYKRLLRASVWQHSPPPVLQLPQPSSLLILLFPLLP